MKWDLERRNPFNVSTAVNMATRRGIVPNQQFRGMSENTNMW